MKCLLLSLFFVVIGFCSSFAQEVSDYKIDSDLKKTINGVYSGSNVYMISGSGAYSFDPVTELFETFSKAGGLSGATLSAVAGDASGNIWFGCQDGTIDIFHPSSNSFSRILDIANSDRSFKQINGIEVKNGSVYVASKFGLSVINAEDYSFVDTYFRFGDFPSNTEVYDSYAGDLLYAATPLGIARQKEGAANLSSPDSWINFTVFDGLPSNKCLEIERYQNTLLCGTDKGLSYYDGTGWQSYSPQLDGKYIRDLFVSGDSLIVIASYVRSNVTYYDVYFYLNGVITDSLMSYEQVSKVAGVRNGEIYFASDKGLLRNSPASSAAYFVPNGPPANLFSGLAVDGTGTLWVATGTDVTGVGFASLEDQFWKTSTVYNTPGLLSNSLFNVYAAPDNTVYFGNWGRGFLSISPDSVISIFMASNTGLVGIAADPNFLVISAIRTDSKKNAWILNFDAGNRKCLSVLTPDSTWYHIMNPSSASVTEYRRLLIDQFDTKWFCSDVRKGVFYYNESGTFDVSSDDFYGFVSESNGLNGESITALALDKRGDIWVGTNLGVNVISNTSSVIGGTGISGLQISSLFSLRQQTITAIAVDALNRKWVGTNQGLLLFSSDGTQLIEAVTKANSPLLNDQIESIAIDDKTGRVYVGTGGGLLSFLTNAQEPVQQFSELFVYPSPFLLGEGTARITIDGLVAESQLKILTVSGEVIRDFSSPGGRVAYWDGKDGSGNYVSSGVYIIAASDAEGNAIATAKIAVIRK